MKSILLIFAVLLSFNFSAQAKPDLSQYMVEDPGEAPIGKLFDEEAYFRGELAVNQFVNVIVINKAAKGEGAQTLRFYSNRQLVLTTKVSTGVENVEYVSGIKSFFRRFGRGALRSHWRHTTRGYYVIKRVYDADYRSGENKFHMPYAMFFNDVHGLAVHQVPPDLKGGEQAGINALGHRASSGCVRVIKDDVIRIHDAVVAADQGDIPVIDSKTGLQVVGSNGQPEFTKGYRSIVIVEEN
jgi:hypothetical protein